MYWPFKQTSKGLKFYPGKCWTVEFENIKRAYLIHNKNQTPFPSFFACTVNMLAFGGKDNASWRFFVSIFRQLRFNLRVNMINSCANKAFTLHACKRCCNSSAVARISRPSWSCFVLVPQNNLYFEQGINPCGENDLIVVRLDFTKKYEGQIEAQNAKQFFFEWKVRFTLLGSLSFRHFKPSWNEQLVDQLTRKSKLKTAAC